MSRIKGFVAMVPSFLQKAFSVYIVLVLIAIAFVAPFINYACREFQANFGFIYLPIAIVIGFLLFSTISRISLITQPKCYQKLRDMFTNDRRFTKLLICLGLILFATQLLITFGVFFRTQWDVAVITDVDNRLAGTSYYSKYPNQMFLAGLFSVLAIIGSHVGFHSAYLFLALGGVLCTSVSITLVSFVSRKLFGKKWSVVAFALMTLLIGWNPMCLIPYSDSYGMLCPSIVLFTYVCIGDRNAKCLIIPFFSYLGYCVKPTAIFVLAAIVIVELCKTVRTIDPKAMKLDLRVALRYTLLMIVSFVLAVGLSSLMKGFAGVEPNEDGAFSPMHYLMMGFNEETDGVFSGTDVNFSASFENRADRDAADFEVWQERVGDMGLLGVLKLMVVKSLITYDSGVFSFLIEGHAFVSVSGKIPLLLEWYGITPDDMSGKTFTSPWAALSQVLWLIILIGIALLLFAKRVPPEIMAIAITLLFLSGFLLLFECRARYLFLYAPYFVLLGVAGWKSLMERSGGRERWR